MGGLMGTALNYKKEIMELTKGLPEPKIKELIDFAQFLRLKEEGFSYKQVDDSAQYVRKLRGKEGRRIKSGKKYIEELIEWQKSGS
jgi:hypothetical protein